MIFLMHRRGIVGDDPTALRLARRWAKVSALLFAIGATGLRITLAHKPTLAEVSCPSVPPGQHGNPPRSADWSSPAGVGRALSRYLKYIVAQLIVELWRWISVGALVFQAAASSEVASRQTAKR